MPIRVVRFTDVTRERIDGLKQRIESSDGPPPGVRAQGMQVLFDEGQGTAVVLQHYASAEDMQESARVFEAMDSAETPGTRASVDTGELVVETSA